MSQQPEWSDHPTRAETGVAELPTIPGYELTGELGRGGMGVVYSAVQISSGQPVAVKVIRDGALAGPRELARFRIEAEAAARMRHPNFVHILEVGEHLGRPFLVMEQVDGHNLAQHLAGQPQPARAAAELVRTLAYAIAHAHERKVVHRDLKPENVLLSGGQPKITDFGLAKRLDTESTAWTQAGAVIGTPAYMAPEQAAGRVNEIGPAADIYALGVLLYEMLTGRPPFAAESWDRMVQLVLNADPSPLPDVPADLETICLKCLEKEIDKRYATASELADDLDRFLAGSPVAAVPPSAADRLARAADRDGYRLVAEIGRGPQSVVYHARYGPLDQPVAVKVFPAGFCTADEWTTRLRCGSGALAALNHPHVLSVRQAVWWDNRPCLISEFVPQGSLATPIGGRLAPVRDSVRLVVRLAELVGYLHRQGAVHGNLKPSNVLMAADGIPRVTDPYLMSGLFQCPLPMSEKDPAALARVAPEIIRDPKDEPRPYTDVYGLGMILYEMLTGRPPFAAETASEVCEQVLTREPIPPSRLNPQVPQPLDWIVSRCLQKDRWQRYPRAYDLLIRLRKAIDAPNNSGERGVPRRGSGLEGLE